MASATCEKKHYHEGFKLRAYATLYIVYIYIYIFIYTRFKSNFCPYPRSGSAALI